MREYTSTITFGRDRSRYRALASDGKVQHGKTPNAVIADELYAWDGRAGQRQWEALDSALVKVPGTLMVVATTTGRGQENLAWKTIDYAIMLVCLCRVGDFREESGRRFEQVPTGMAGTMLCAIGGALQFKDFLRMGALAALT